MNWRLTSRMVKTIFKSSYPRQALISGLYSYFGLLSTRAKTLRVLGGSTLSKGYLSKGNLSQNLDQDLK